MEPVSTPADLGAMARAARISRGWTQQQAADAAGVSRRFVNMVEGGRHLNAEVWRVLALMNALGAPLQAAVPAAHSALTQVTATDAGSVSSRETETDQVSDTAADFDLDAHLVAFRRMGE